MIDNNTLCGFGNHFSTEALPNTLPDGQNTPQRVNHGLYSEQLSGTSFTSPRHENLRSWLYRIQPSAVQSAFQPIKKHPSKVDDELELVTTPNPLRWDPFTAPSKPTDFIEGLMTLAVAKGSSRGCAAQIYSLSKSMEDSFFYNADGELLFVPEKGSLLLRTEMGELQVKPTEIAVVPRGVKFQVQLQDSFARGYICENFGLPFRLPSLGPIGSNGLANPRDFIAPHAKFEQVAGNFKLFCKFQGQMFVANLNHSPLDVVAWHGNYTPYKYDLKRFQTYSPVSFDHPDPSIFTVLTSPSEIIGTANVDFVIFPPRWMVAEHTFRPPYYHRNVMSEFMGLITGQYDARGTGFVPGGASIHNSMTAHGPDSQAFEKATETVLKPQYMQDTMAFMFECSLAFLPTSFAMQSPSLQKDYESCWAGLKVHFKTS